MTLAVDWAVTPQHKQNKTLKYLAITLIRPVKYEVKLVWEFLILTQCNTYFLSYTYTNL